MSKKTINIEVDVIRYIQQQQVVLHMPVLKYKEIETVLTMAAEFNTKLVEQTPKLVEQVTSEFNATLIKARPTVVILTLLTVLSDTSRVYVDNNGNEYCKPRGCKEMLNMSYNDYVERPSGVSVPIIRDYTIK